MPCVTDGSLETGRHGGGAGPYTRGGSDTLPLIKLSEQLQKFFLVAATSARALDPLWNLKPNKTTWQSVRSKKIRINFNGLYGGRTRTRTWDPLMKSQRVKMLGIGPNQQ